MSRYTFLISIIWNIMSFETSSDIGSNNVNPPTAGPQGLKRKGKYYIFEENNKVDFLV